MMKRPSPFVVAITTFLLPLILWAADCFDPNNPGEEYLCYDSGQSYAKGYLLGACTHYDGSPCYTYEWFTVADEMGERCRPMGPIPYGPPVSGKDKCKQSGTSIMTMVWYMEFVCGNPGFGGCDLVNDYQRGWTLPCDTGPFVYGDECSQPIG